VKVLREAGHEAALRWKGQRRRNLAPRCRKMLLCRTVSL
jgi:hypothetical protein